EGAAAARGGNGRVAELQRQIDALRLRYTDEHPDIVALRRQMQLLRSQGANERRAVQGAGGREGRDAPTQGATTIPNTVYEQIRLRLSEEETNIAALERRLAEAEAEVARLRELASQVPAIEAELANLDRDYNVIKTNYELMLTRRESARIAQAAD